MTPKSNFFLIGARTITPKGSMNTHKKKNLEKPHCLLSKIMNNKQVLVYRLLQLKNNLRSIFVENIHSKKLMKF